MPAAASCSPIQALLVSTIWPRSSSVPIARTSHLTGPARSPHLGASERGAGSLQGVRRRGRRPLAGGEQEVEGRQQRQGDGQPEGGGPEMGLVPGGGGPHQ